MVQPFLDMRIGVVGGGSWGTALAHLLADKGYTVDWWIYEPDLAQRIRETRENDLFLPGVVLSQRLMPTNELQKAVAGKDLVLVVVPSHVMRTVTSEMAPHLQNGTIIVSASKGIENSTLLTMSGVIRDCLPNLDEDRLAVLSGPSFAREVALGMPTVVSVAAREPDCAQKVQAVFATPAFRVYTNDDLVGVELGGAVKNVIAIAAGMVDGLGLGLNTRAALITRGLTEIRRLGRAMGANPRTFTGSAGVGDLVLTCTGDVSRNHTIGKKIGQGMQLADLLQEMRMVAEGVKTARSVYNLSLRLGVEMPISHAVYRILYEQLAPKEAVYQLMTRDLKNELDED
ncbi:NAD(P)H-dependent glycerol-3-phosphate dehydrogenase [Desulfatitalea alkaliphila]|uniref:Glycerol-3-phosphate dehydrogenase [NAD(P)+] n=1 Tax=Desulfatitalea alkaliphila TaxID=2929485 RepID=A0AA41UKT3_9BACT|nr:NAD(P)H-dependent glycerol-3-phosphate dehydrogenase [Desulfatitalea alkaliphila]MCJ8500776.1 NAD(P)-dependent glycerol-3-phosphate dehydrogenase [Desulfatitalea alkaliphila]